MSAATNQDTLDHSIELINSGDVDAGVAALFAEDAVDHDPAPGQGTGRAGFLDFFRTLATAFPDLKLERRHLNAAGEYVSMAFTVSGTHQGEFNGLEPTGHAFRANGVEIFRFHDAQVVERWGLTDDLGILAQLGLVSPPH